MALLHFPPRTIALAGAGCVLVGWLLASTLTPPVARVQSRPSRSAAAAPLDAALAMPERVRLDRPTALPRPSISRNPFVFVGRMGTPRPAPAPAVSTPDLVPDMATPAMSPASVPPFTLAGMIAGGGDRRAVLADGRAVHLVKVGDRLDVFEVVEITPDSVTLQDAGQIRYVLRLKP